MYTHTHTHTVYFTEERLTALRREVTELRHDAERRGQFIGDDALTAMRRRLGVLEAAVDLLREPVPPEFGG